MTLPQQEKKIRARRLLEIPLEDLPKWITGEFTLITDDGVEVKTDARKVFYSAFAWEYHRQFPQMPIKANHLFEHVVKSEEMLTPSTHLDLIGQVCFDTYDFFVNKQDYMAHLPEGPIEEIDFRDRLAKLAYEITNKMYNVLSYHCEEYVTSFDITDAMKLLAHPRIRAANNALDADNGDRTVMEEQINHAYREIDYVLEKDDAYKYNPMCQAVRTKTVKKQQVKQSLGPRGFLTDIDSNLFQRPIMRGYLRGLRSAHDLLVESRSAAKSLAFTEKPLQDAEYFSRRLQLISQILKNLHVGDCGSKQYLIWNVRKSDLKLLDGKHYVMDDGALGTIRKTDSHLIGRTLKLRSVIHCEHPDGYGVCSTCFGESYMAIPRGTNVGHACCSRLGQEASQLVMSTKHFDGSAEVYGIVIRPDQRPYLKASPDGMSYLLSDQLKGKKVKLQIRPEFAPGLTDIQKVDDVRQLHENRVSEMYILGMVTEMTLGNIVTPNTVTLHVGLERRPASLTYAFLEYIRKVGWEIDGHKNYVVDMSGWDASLPIMNVPLKHYNMSDHSNAIADMLESSVEEMEHRDKHMEASALLVEFHDLVNSKQLNMNLAINEIVVYGTMIISAEEGDYRLPKPWTKSGFGVMKKTMMYRSSAPGMAYQNHRQILTNPESYCIPIRPDHPLDGILMPYETFGNPGDTSDWDDYLHYRDIRDKQRLAQLQH